MALDWIVVVEWMASEFPGQRRQRIFAQRETMLFIYISSPSSFRSEFSAYHRQLPYVCVCVCLVQREETDINRSIRDIYDDSEDDSFSPSPSFQITRTERESCR